MALKTLMPPPYFTAIDADGEPVPGARIYVNRAGLTTPTTVYQDAVGVAAHARPVVCDSAGRAVIFQDAETVDILIHDASDVLVRAVESVAASAPYSLDLNIQDCVAGEALAAGNVAYLSGGDGGTVPGRWYKTDADATAKSSTATMVAMVPTAIAQGGTGTLQVQGRFTGLTGLSVGVVYYCSATAGALTSVAPANVRLVGVADSTTSLMLFSSATGNLTLVSSLGYVALESVGGVGQIIGTVNASAESGGTLRVASSKIHIDASTTFAANYDPSLKAEDAATTIALGLKVDENGGILINGTLDNPTIGDGTLTSPNINYPTIVYGTIASAAITISSFAGGTISGVTMSGSTINTATINAPYLASPTIATPAITGGTIASAAISSPTISTPTITGGTIAGTAIAGDISDSGISDSTITTSVINTSTINTPTINAPAINKATITGTAISDLALTDVIINGGLINDPTIINGTISSATLNSPTVVGGILTSGTQVTDAAGFFGATIFHSTVTIEGATTITSDGSLTVNGAATLSGPTTITDGTITDATIASPVISTATITVARNTAGTGATTDFDTTKAYTFTFAGSGYGGLWLHNPSTSDQDVILESASPSGSSNVHQVIIRAMVGASGSMITVGSGSGGDIAVVASDRLTLTGGTDVRITSDVQVATTLRISTTDSTTDPGLPWMHGDGTALTINAEPLYLNFDVTSEIITTGRISPDGDGADDLGQASHRYRAAYLALADTAIIAGVKPVITNATGKLFTAAGFSGSHGGGTFLNGLLVSVP